MTDYQLLPNEVMVLEEYNVAHGEVGLYTDDLCLTNLNLIWVNKGVFGGTKNVYVYPLNMIQRRGATPQIMTGKLRNGKVSLDFFINGGGRESFSFREGSRRKANRWVETMLKVIAGDDDPSLYSSLQRGNDYDSDTLVGAFKEFSDELKDARDDFLDALGFIPKEEPIMGSDNSFVSGLVPGVSNEKITKKCMSCSAPLSGYRGQTVKCKYCDTEQTL